MVNKRLAVVGGLVIGLLTLRSLRKRRAGADESRESEDYDESPEHAELESATDHAVAAVDHARTAASMKLEERREAA